MHSTAMQAKRDPALRYATWLLVLMTSTLVHAAQPGLWSSAGNMSNARYAPTATRLASGKVLLTGSSDNDATTDLYDLASNSWSTSGSLSTGRTAATASLLTNGTVLVAGGNAANNCTTTFTGSGSTTVCYATASSELYNAAGGSWSAAHNSITPRQTHTATVLASGKVLIAGGSSDCTTVVDPSSEAFYCSYVATAELYDPISDTWSSAGTLANPRYAHTATLLASGKVLLSGGRNNGGILASAELYDPASNSWSAVATLNTARFSHSATVLPSGKVYVAGGYSNSGVLVSAEIYDPSANSWTAAKNLSTARADHSAILLTSGKVMIAAGDAAGSSDLIANPDLYDPATDTITVGSPMLAPRFGRAAVVLNSGKAMIIGGVDGNGQLASAEVFDPTGSTYTVTGKVDSRGGGTIDPSTQTINAGGTASFTVTPTGISTVLGVSGDTCSVSQTSGTTWSTSAIAADCVVTASFFGAMSTFRYEHTATRLASGKVLLAGGSDCAVADLYDPVTQTFSTAGSMLSPRYMHTATLLPSGKVLVTGGTPNLDTGSPLATTELYDPASNS